MQGWVSQGVGKDYLFTDSAQVLSTSSWEGFQPALEEECEQKSTVLNPKGLLRDTGTWPRPLRHLD